MFVFSVIFFASLIALSNYTVQIPINDWLTYGALVYPLTFLLTDVLSEKYEKQEVLKVVRYGVILAVVPTILVSDIRIALASITAFFVVQHLDVHIFHALKDRFPRYWWLRNNASTLTSQLVDTVIFFTLAFAFEMPWVAIVKLILGDYMIKVIMALLDTPFFYAIAVRKNRLFYPNS